MVLGEPETPIGSLSLIIICKLEALELVIRLSETQEEGEGGVAAMKLGLN